jgi:hypothetical protein
MVNLQILSDYIHQLKKIFGTGILHKSQAEAFDKICAIFYVPASQSNCWVKAPHHFTLCSWVLLKSFGQTIFT